MTARREVFPAPGPPSADSMRRAGDREVDVERLAAEVDWAGVLPVRSQGLAWRVEQAVKRPLDVVGAAAGLVLLLPLFVVLGVLIVLDSGWPVLYEWRVVGRRGRRFTGYKLRTMVPHADWLKQDLLHLNQMTGPVFKVRDDPRVTRLGRILRRYSLDEFPQLWSVLVGHMSLVGPRPLFPDEFERCPKELRGKLAVRPGMTCLWQVSGRNEISDFSEWARLDLQYVRNWTLLLDAKILVRTVVAVVKGRGAY